MPTKFSEFFKLASDADDFQKRVYVAISNATTIVECYQRIYEYIIGGLKWHSRQDRHDLMDATVDVQGLDQQQMDDAKLYFEEGEFEERDNRVLFEYLIMKKQDINEYGPNVFILQFDEQQKVAAQKACRQVQLYSQVEIYNQEYGRQLKHYNDNHLPTRPPNDEIKIDPRTSTGRIDPDDQNPDQIKRLNEFVDDLVQWVKKNYQTLHAILQTTTNDLFSLIFVSALLTDQEKMEAVEVMLDSIRYQGDSTPVSTRKAFGLWVIEQLKPHKDFWQKAQVSSAYGDIKKLKAAFGKNASKNLKIYEFFNTLFANFLSPNRYGHETQQQAETRRATALEYIDTIFKGFVPSQNNPVIVKKYGDMMSKALLSIKGKYESRYTNNLRRASEKIPANDQINSVLSNDLADALKEKADQLLRTLPLQRDGKKAGFFTIPNFEALEALNQKSVIILKRDEARSSVVVPADPLEDNLPRYRPIYRAFRYSTSRNQAIAFCNLPDLKGGTFYYQYLDNPSGMEVPASKFFAEALTIDFQNYTINYKSKKTDKTKNDAGQQYRSGASTVFFFDDLKKKTKWTKIKGGRRYDPYYSTIPIDEKLSEPHLAAYVAAGRGVARALPLGDNNLCVWFWNCSNQFHRQIYNRLGEVLGLPTSRQIVPTGTGGLAELQNLTQPCTVEIGGTQCQFVNYGLRQFRTSGFHYPIIGITKPKEDEQFYVQVNGPGPSVAAVLTTDTRKQSSRPLTDDPKSILGLFNFCYYRLITSKPDDQTKKPLFTEDSKVIQLFAKGDKRKPSGPGTTVIKWTDDKFDAIAANLPICFNVKENVIQYFLDKQRRGKIINKGNPLFREQKPRKDAGTAMNAIFGKLKPPLSTELSASKLPATAFANGAMRQSPAAQQDWGVLKIASSNYLPVNQEWCHLRGHGDGGDEYPGNFVSGSYHCNTEQLAIETGQRLVTQQMPERSFLLHTTAYLLRDATNYKSKVDDERKSQILTANYLENEQAYKDMLDNNIARRSREQNAGNTRPVKKQKPNDMVIDSPTLEQGDVAPLAAYLRYKVMRCETTGQGSSKRTRDDETLSKYFDFIFEGQSEFTDKNQFTIISQAVQFALAGIAVFQNWYEQAKAELDSKSV